MYQYNVDLAPGADPAAGGRSWWMLTAELTILVQNSEETVLGLGHQKGESGFTDKETKKAGGLGNIWTTQGETVFFKQPHV